MIITLIVTLLTTGTLFLFMRRVNAGGSKHLPPGPPRLPIFGNVFEIAQGRWYETFSRWQKVYGDIFYASAPGTPLIVLNSYKAAEELLGKGIIHAGRPQSLMVRFLMGWEWNPAFMNPSKELNQLRAYMRQALGPQMILRYRPFIYAERTNLVKALVDFEGDPDKILNTTIGAIITKISYGEEIFGEYGERILNSNREAMILTTPALTQFWAVDVFPFLRYVPGWVPGFGFKRLAEKTTELTKFIRFTPWEFVLGRMNRPGGYEDCMVTHMIEKEGATDQLRDAIAILYTAGSDTIHGSVMIFILCMILYPKIQKRAQEEIDTVVGQKRLPTFDDFSALRYVEAAWKESMRWRPIIPLGLPHMSIDQDSFKDYWIPKGSLILPNIGFMLRDESVWDHPEVYDPERFLIPLQPDQPDPAIGFGFGRRVCPGRFLAEEVGPCLAATLLWAFRLERISGPATADEIQWVDSSLSPPLPFEVRFRPRSEKIRDSLSRL